MLCDLIVPTLSIPLFSPFPILTALPLLLNLHLIFFLYILSVGSFLIPPIVLTFSPTALVGATGLEFNICGTGTNLAFKLLCGLLNE